MNNLSVEVTLYVFNLLPSELDMFSFAFVNKRHWEIFSVPTADALRLGSNITALQLRKCYSLIIQDRYYDKKFLEFVFSHARSLHTILPDNRQNCSFEFSLNLLRSTNRNKKVTFVVPQSFERKFNFIVEEEEMHHITIEISEDEDRIDVSKIVTPESVLTKVEYAKNILKRSHYLANKEFAVMKNDLSYMIASPINRFFNSKSYHVWENDFTDNLLMKKTDLNAVEASRIVSLYGPKLVESVVILEKYWFFMTSFSFFIHNNLQIDDCADMSKVGHQKKAVSFIRRKTSLGKDYFELTFRFGQVELLATSGFFGSIDGAFFSPFLGSSVRELPASIINSFQTVSTDVIFVANQQKEYICKNRIVNQYYKPTAKNDWGFYSRRYEEEGFSPANPLSFESQNIMHSAASLVLKSFTYEDIYQKEMDELLLKVLPQDKSIYKLINKYLVFLNQHQNSSFSLSPLKETKKDLIEIYNTLLVGALKSSNIKHVKSAKERYTVTKKIDLLFADEDNEF